MCRLDIANEYNYLLEGGSPLQKLFDACVEEYNLEKNATLCGLIEELRQKGYVRNSFINLRGFLLNKDFSYCLPVLAGLMKNALAEGVSVENVTSVPQQEPDSTWMYDRNMVEYINLRALGVNDSKDKVQRTGTFLDFIVYMLQSRSEVFHIAPFHRHIKNLIYSPTDMYSIMDSLVAPELTEIGLSPFEQLKLVLDFGHAQKIKRAFLIDTLPHTGELSVNYIYKPEQAHWLALDKDLIDSRKKIFKQGKAIIKKALKEDIAGVESQELKKCFGIDIVALVKLLAANSTKPKAKRQELLENKLRKKLVSKTRIIANAQDKEILNAETTKAWNNGKDFIARELIKTDSHRETCNAIYSVVIDKLGLNYTYKDLQASEEEYSGSVAKHLREKERIYNLPVGAWDGGEAELIGFNVTYNKPVFACKSFKKRKFGTGSKEKYYNVAGHCFDSISRRQFRLASGRLNTEAITEFIDIYSFYLQLGFDGLRIDQVDNVMYEDFGFVLGEVKSLKEYFSNMSYSYDTILKDDLRFFISELKKLQGEGVSILLEDMMPFSVYRLPEVFSRMHSVRADTIIGHFQFMESIPKLLLRVQEHNLTKLYKQEPCYVMNTIECHDNDMTLGGTSPVCKDAGGPEKLRLRMLVNAIGLPYISMQAMNAVNSERSKDYQMQYSINHPQNLNFKKYKSYTIGKKRYQFDIFRHNYFDFLNRPEIKELLKGGIIRVQNAKLSDSSRDGIFAFTVHNKSPHYLFVVFNSSRQDAQNVWLKNMNLDWYEGPGEVLQFDLDCNFEGPLEPVKTTLHMYNENGKRHAFYFEKLYSYDLKIYLM